MTLMGILKLVFISVQLIVMGSFSVYAQSYDTYCNARYNYCIAYPSSLVPQKKADNGDGRKFLSKDKNVVLTVYHTYGIQETPEMNLKEEYNRLLKDTEVTYKVFKQKWFVVSGYRHNKIIYQKSYSNEDGLKIFILEYPVDQKERWNRECGKIAASFNPKS